jgi:hypothetical protein
LHRDSRRDESQGCVAAPEIRDKGQRKSDPGWPSMGYTNSDQYSHYRERRPQPPPRASSGGARPSHQTFLTKNRFLLHPLNAECGLAPAIITAGSCSRNRASHRSSLGRDRRQQRSELRGHRV